MPVDFRARSSLATAALAGSRARSRRLCKRWSPSAMPNRSRLDTIGDDARRAEPRQRCGKHDAADILKGGEERSSNMELAKLYWIAINGSGCALSRVRWRNPATRPRSQQMFGFPTLQEAQEAQKICLTAPVEKVEEFFESLRPDVQSGRVAYRRPNSPEPPTRGQTAWMEAEDESKPVDGILKIVNSTADMATQDMRSAIEGMRETFGKPPTFRTFDEIGDYDESVPRDGHRTILTFTIGMRGDLGQSSKRSEPPWPGKRPWPNIPRPTSTRTLPDMTPTRVNCGRSRRCATTCATGRALPVSITALLLARFQTQTTHATIWCHTCLLSSPSAAPSKTSIPIGYV